MGLILERLFVIPYFLDGGCKMENVFNVYSEKQHSTKKAIEAWAEGGYFDIDLQLHQLFSE